jgi:AcrR family transcriptional regulator
MSSMISEKSAPEPVNASELSSPGQKSREAILLAAARLATTRGLDGLSIGDLAAEVGMSKSGLYAHFKSKEELELATIEMAVQIFQEDVLQPALAAPPGVKRLMALVDAFLSHIHRRVFPGGCFFAAVAAELDTRPGRARDRVAEIQSQWLTLLEQCFRDGQANGEIHPRADLAQAVFEADAMLIAGNFLFVMSADPSRLKQARQGVEHVLARLAPDSAPSRAPRQPRR